MDWLLFLQAFGLFLVFEGLWPFLSPLRWREAMTRLAGLSDRHIRLTALASMAGGLLLLWCSH